MLLLFRRRIRSFDGSKDAICGFFCLASFFVFPLQAQAAGGLNFYQSFLEKLGVEASLRSDWQVLPAAVFATCFIGFSCWLYSRWANQKLNAADLTPASKVSLAGIMEAVASFITDLTESVIGKGFQTFVPLLLTLFLFIIVNNLMGLIPGFPPATENFSTNLALGLVVFLVYNYAGIREHGASYLKQFMGPFLILAPLFVGIEIISHLSRPLSLSLRLYANLFGDHLLVGIFQSLVPLIVPALLLLFGLLVACVQSFIFVLLTGIYISMAKSHDH